MATSKAAATKKLTQAFASPDDDVTPTGNRKAHSLVSQIEALDVGDSASRALQVSPDITFDEYATEGPSMREALRNSVSASMRKARERTGNSYEVEVSDMMMTSRKLFMVAIISRTA